jgi:hypothetical protein
MPALVAGIHVFLKGESKKGVDGRNKPSHDGVVEPPYESHTQIRVSYKSAQSGFI